MIHTAQENKKRLEVCMSEYAKEDICLAFSGGVDSSLLLKAAACEAEKTGKKVFAVTFDSRLHPTSDLKNAEQVARELGGIHRVIAVNELEQEEIRFNPVNRCYLCKHHLFSSLKKLADDIGAAVIMDGTNEDDMHVYRPGIAALKELGIKSPLADLHMTKKEVKELAALYGISVASRPSAPCMATRLPYDAELNYDVLRRLEEGEAYLRKEICGNIRLRLHQDIVRIEVDKDTFSAVLAKHDEITAALKNMGFLYITLDLEGFRSGSMDIKILPE